MATFNLADPSAQACSTRPDNVIYEVSGVGRTSYTHASRNFQTSANVEDRSDGKGTELPWTKLLLYQRKPHHESKEAFCGKIIFRQCSSWIMLVFDGFKLGRILCNLLEYTDVWCCGWEARCMRLGQIILCVFLFPTAFCYFFSTLLYYVHYYWVYFTEVIIGLYPKITWRGNVSPTRYPRVITAS